MENKGKMKYSSLIQDDETRRLMNELIREASSKYIAAEVFTKVFEEGYRHNGK